MIFDIEWSPWNDELPHPSRIYYISNNWEKFLKYSRVLRRNAWHKILWLFIRHTVASLQVTLVCPNQKQKESCCTQPFLQANVTLPAIRIIPMLYQPFHVGNDTIPAIRIIPMLYPTISSSQRYTTCNKNSNVTLPGIRITPMLYPTISASQRYTT